MSHYLYLSRGVADLPYFDSICHLTYLAYSILSAKLDLDLIIAGKFDLDVVGHYSRPDLFKLVSPQL